MNTDHLDKLVRAYRDAPTEFQATEYWASYEAEILDTIRSMDLDQLRSGKYPILATFGYTDQRYSYHPNMPFWKRGFLKFLHSKVMRNRGILPYNVRASDLCEFAYRHCQLAAAAAGAAPIETIEASRFGGPADLFEFDGRVYTMPFLNYYMRYCYAQKVIPLTGNETIVELGTGSGYQIEVLKKIHPDLTVLCFDLPAQIFLCEQYLSNALVGSEPVGTETTQGWKDLSGLQPGKIHFFGNWQFPLLREFSFDIFWNAASFGEMEPAVVANYLGYVKGHAEWIYLMQARHGKGTRGNTRVREPISFEDYQSMLDGYALQETHDAWQAIRRYWESGGYFEAFWKRQ